LGGGGIDGAIHGAAGNDLYEECRTLHGCRTGFTKLTRGYNLPAKYVLHTVGPIVEEEKLLQSCYKTVLQVAKEHNKTNYSKIKTLAFCGVSTGIFGYPLESACQVALETVREWLEEGNNRNEFDLIIFCTYLPRENQVYRLFFPIYFPVS